MISKAIKEAFKLKAERNWDTLYFAVDLHGTIIEPGRLKILTPYPKTKEALQYLCSFEDIVLILFTSTKQELLEEFYIWCTQNQIRFKYFNTNPECENTHEGDYTQKFYYNVIIDDRAGFDPLTDWDQVISTIREIRGE